MRRSNFKSTLKIGDILQRFLYLVSHFIIDLLSVLELCLKKNVSLSVIESLIIFVVTFFKKYFPDDELID